MPEGVAAQRFEEDVPQGRSTSLAERLASLQPRLEAYLFGRAPGLDSGDLAQEALARALRYRASLDGARDPWPWLRRVADHVLVDHFRRRGRTGTTEELEESQHAAPGTGDALAARDELRRALAVLRPVEREVLLRFHHLGASVREIATHLGVPEGTVKSHLSRARRRLATFDDPDPDHG